MSCYVGNCTTLENCRREELISECSSRDYDACITTIVQKGRERLQVSQLSSPFLQPTVGWRLWRNVGWVRIVGPVSTTGGRTNVIESLTRTPTPAPPAAPTPCATRPPPSSTVSPPSFSLFTSHLINLLTAGGYFHFSPLQFNRQDLFICFDKK